MSVASGAALVGLLLVGAGAVLLIVPWAWFRPLGHGAFVLGTSVLAGRYLGVAAAGAVAAAGLLPVWLILPLHRRRGDGDPLGVPLRMLLGAFAAMAAIALATTRPLGGEPGAELNLAWYWAGAIALLLLTVERGTGGVATGAALLVSAAGLALFFFLTMPSPLLVVLLAALPAVLALGARWIGADPLRDTG